MSHHIIVTNFRRPVYFSLLYECSSVCFRPSTVITWTRNPALPLCNNLRTAGSSFKSRFLLFTNVDFVTLFPWLFVCVFLFACSETMTTEQRLLSIPELSHHLAESYLTCCLYLQEMLQYKRQNHGKVRRFDSETQGKQCRELWTVSHISYSLNVCMLG